MSDKLITAMTVSKNIHAYIALTKDLVQKGAKSHKLNAISECIFARAVTACCLLSGTLKNPNDKLILTWNCTGPAKKILVESGYSGEVRGFIENTNLDLIESSIKNGDINSEPYIGFGDITVSRYSQNYATPYHSVSCIESGEIAHDIAVYLEQSLQVQSAINIGLQISNKSELEVCGGILLMAMPGATDEEIKDLFDKFDSIQSFTQLMGEATKNEQNFFDDLLAKFNLEKVSEKPLDFVCHCDGGSVQKILSSLTEEQLQEYKDDNGKINVTCQYCGKEYTF